MITNFFGFLCRKGYPHGEVNLGEKKGWSFSLPYEMDGKVTSMFPDFLFFRKIMGKWLVDIIEPHDFNRTEFVPKVLGLAKFASEHGDNFARIETVIKRNDRYQRIDLNILSLRENVLRVSSLQHLFDIFDRT